MLQKHPSCPQNIKLIYSEAARLSERILPLTSTGLCLPSLAGPESFTMESTSLLPVFVYLEHQLKQTQNHLGKKSLNIPPKNQEFGLLEVGRFTPMWVAPFLRLGSSTI